MTTPSQPMRTVAGVIEAPVPQVWTALLDSNPLLTPEDREAIARHSGPQPWSSIKGEHLQGRTHIEVDPQRHRIAVEGDWWYRGVHSVEAHERGSLLVYRVYNIAPGVTRLAVPLMQRGLGGQMRDQLQQLLGALGTRLHCATQLVAR